MSTTVSKTVVVAELTTYDDQIIVFPLAFPETTWFANRGNDMLTHFQKALQKEVLDQSMLLSAMHMQVPVEFVERELEVAILASKDTAALKQKFHLFSAELADGRCHSFLPALGIEILSEDAASVDDDAREHIRLEHMRHGRFTDVGKLISTQWYKEIRLRHFSIDLKVLGPDEQVKEQVNRLLPDAAAPMRHTGATVAGLDDALAELTKRVEGKFSRSVMVVGAESSGKTSLLQAYSASRQQRGLNPVWETSAVRLLQALTRDGGWQKNLSILCNELYDGEEILYIGHISELFEVGQYQGNSISIGAALRDQLQRGRILLLAEASESELAKLELINNGYAALFQELRMPRWDEQQQQRVVGEAVRARGREHQVEVMADAVEEAILLQRRYSPYSGFPGKPIRFIESLILQQKIRAANVMREHVVKAFCAETGIPQALLDANMALDTNAMREFFRQRIFGQDTAIDLVCDTLLSIKSSMARAGKPIASLLLIGPTGVGKTETAKALAEYMFGDAERMLRFDMSEYADPASVLRLTGDLGADEGALVTRIRQQPFSVVLFDELEKAHYSFFDLLLQILGEGRLSGGKGQLANFCSSVIIMTSNIGATEMQKNPIGLHPTDSDKEGVVRHFEQAVQNYFRPELFNRLDHIVPYAPLADAQRRPIMERELNLLRKREGIRGRALNLDVDPTVIDQLCAGAHDDRYGARHMQRGIQDQLVFPLARVLSAVPHTRSLTVSVRTDVDRLEFISRQGNFVLQSPALTQAEELAEKRRQLQKILAGPVWTELVNRQYMLEMQKQKIDEKEKRSWELNEKEQRFWELNGKEYKALNHLLADGRRLLQNALQGEGEYLLEQSSMEFGLEAKSESLATGTRHQPFDAKEWDAAYVSFKGAVLGMSRPDANRCTIGLYGPLGAIDTLREVYLGVAEIAGLEVRTQMVKLVQDEFKKYLLPILPTVKIAEGHVIGYEIECVGDSAYYLFSGERGVWRQAIDDKTSLNMYVSVTQKSLEKTETPANVYRKSFYDGLQIVREIKEDIVSGPKSAWQCVYPHPNALHAQLMLRWGSLADDILIGEETV